MQDVARTVGRFEIVRRIGRGGMAVVYLARQRGLDREVALKELRTFDDSVSSLAERFLREARVAGAMAHQNIVTVFDYFEEDGTPFIAMEYLPHGSLRPLIGRLSLAQVVGALDGLLGGLAHAETHGVVHRDLKPENLLVTGDGSIKIADFGIAKAYNQVSLGLTGTGMAIGTPSYMSPEQAMAKEVGPWTDLYATGVIAYELLVGRVPFVETDTPLSILWQHVHDPVPPPRSLRPDLDPTLEEWLERMLAKAPGDRPGSAREAQALLEDAVVRLLGWRWRQDASLVERADAPRPAPAPVAPTPATQVPAPPEHVPPPPEDVPPPPEPEPSPAEAKTEAAPTPVVVPPEPEPEPAPTGDDTGWAWPTTVLRPALRRRAPWLAVAIVAAGALGLGAALLFGRSRDSGPGPTTVAPVILPDPAPDPRERVGAVLVDGSIVLSLPRGRLVELDERSLAVTSTTRDPAGPRTAVVHGGAILVAEHDAVARIDPRTLARLGTIPFRGARLAGGAGGPAVVTGSLDGGRGRVCLLDGLELETCARLPFVPSGAGAAPGGAVYVADRAAGAVLELRRRGDRLVSRRRFEVGPTSIPHGPVLRFLDGLYVAVRRGVAVVDPATGRTLRRIRLGTTPPSIWIAPFNRRLFAPLYGRDRVAIVDLATPGARPAVVATGAGPVAVTGHQVSTAGGRDVVYAVLAGEQGVARLDAYTGQVVASRPVPGLTGPDIPRLVATKLRIVRGERRVRATLRFGSGRFDRDSVSVLDHGISDGRAVVEVRQGAITSSIPGAQRAGVAIRLREELGRLRVIVSAERGRFERLSLERGRNGQALALVLVEFPPVVAGTDGGTPQTHGRPTQDSTDDTTPTDERPPDNCFYVGGKLVCVG